MSALHERDAELSAVRALLAGAAAGDGGLLLLSGPAGIGKTAVLRAARDAAAERGVAALAATATPLEREVPFGLVHQLLDGVLAGADPARRARLLAGAAARAEAVLTGEGVPDGTPIHALLHALYWLCANLAELEPVLFAIDDLHWGDAPSLRFLEFLGRRLDGLAIAVVAAARPNEPGARRELLGALEAGPLTVGLTPAPLSAEAVALLLRGSLGATPDAAFTAACRAATGGNPLLLGELARAAAEQALSGAAGEAERAQALGSAGISAAVERRLSAQGALGRTTALAAAVIGERARADDLAVLTGVRAADASAVADRLVAAGLLDPGGWRFVHPLVRDAVLSATPREERSRLHGLYAQRLLERGARAPEVAAHLLQTDAAGDPRTAEVLRGAARAAAADAALETAIAYLERALEEPPAPGDVAPTLLELGELEADHGSSGASARLDAALAAGLSGDEAARARAARARHTLLRDPRAALDDLEAAVAGAEGEDLRLRLESLLFDVTAYELNFAERRAALIEAGRRDPDPSPVVLAHLAQEAAYRSAPAGEVAALARRALADGRLLGVIGAGGTYHLLVMALRHAEQPELALSALRAGEAAVHRQGSRFAMYFMDHARSYWEMMFGSVAIAEAHARSALVITEEAALPLGRMTVVAMLAEVLMERGQLDEAERHLEGLTVTPELGRVISGCDLIGARAELHRLRGRLAEAEADARRARELVQARGWTTPLKSLAGVRLACVLIDAGRPQEALAVLEEDEAAARRAGTPGTLGMLTRVRGRAVGGAEGLALLELAVERLEGSAMVLERAWARYDLGVLRGPGAPAREPLRAALDDATRIGAARLAGLAREALLATGARPRRHASRGPESLTPSERRVSALAADGLGNREIAETLWVSRKTVEQHLAHAYAKLGIRSRAQLADALAEA